MKPWWPLLLAPLALVAWTLRADDPQPPSPKALIAHGIGANLGEVVACGQCHLGIA